MNKFIKRLSIVLSVVLIFIITLFLIWYFQPKRKLNVYILDKTVVRNDRPEHKSLVWILNNNRFVGPDNKAYNASKDYWGFFPIDLANELFDFKAIRINEVDTYSAVYDAAYYADCYGVYSFEWYKNLSQPIHSSKVYGGLNQNDYLLLKKMQESNKLIIGEYNMFSTPTNALIRSKTEALFNLTWTGWAGKTYFNMDPSKPGGPADWMPKLYESQHLKPWPKDSQAIVLISNDGLIDVLPLNESVKSIVPQILTTTEGQKSFGLPVSTPFPCWFEFITPGENSNVIANYKLDLTEDGIKQLDALGLTATFPAIVQAQVNEFTYYFAGDFAENPVWNFSAKLAGGKFINKLFSKNTDRTRFFNSFYTPLIENIFNNYYKVYKQQKQ